MWLARHDMSFHPYALQMPLQQKFECSHNVTGIKAQRKYISLVGKNTSEFSLTTTDNVLYKQRTGFSEIGSA